MRLVSPLFSSFSSPEEWAATVRRNGFTAAFAPVSPETPDDTVYAYVETARKCDIVIAEVGAWCNPIDPDSTKARTAIDKCQQHLDVAERLGARCCVNITGSRNPSAWDGPHPDNLKPETFDRIVETTREIIDAVRPKRTFYTLETMPWIFPSSPDEYLALIRAIDRPGFAVHLDPVNLVNTPARAFDTTALIRECFAKLGPHIKSCHAKDILLRDHLTVHLDECLPGHGVLDYCAFLQELSRLDPNTTLCLEHLSSEVDYALAAHHLRNIAEINHLSLL